MRTFPVLYYFTSRSAQKGTPSLLQHQKQKLICHTQIWSCSAPTNVHFGTPIRIITSIHIYILFFLRPGVHLTLSFLFVACLQHFELQPLLCRVRVETCCLHSICNILEITSTIYMVFAVFENETCSYFILFCAFDYTSSTAQGGGGSFRIGNL